MNYTLFYSVKVNKYEIFETLKTTLNDAPDFIIAVKSKGIHITKFPERTVEDEHFEIQYYNNSGKEIIFRKDNWKVIDMSDPLRYNIVLNIKISDPLGKIRIFDGWNALCHFESVFTNRIEDLINFYYMFDWISEFENWELAENEIFEFRKKKFPKEVTLVCFKPGKLSKYYSA
jgi:hypothetical protein